MVTQVAVKYPLKVYITLILTYFICIVLSILFYVAHQIGPNYWSKNHFCIDSPNWYGNNDIPHQFDVNLSSPSIKFDRYFTVMTSLTPTIPRARLKKANRLYGK